VIIDFKRTDHDLSVGAPSFGRDGLDGTPLAGVVGNDLHRYSLQQHLYAEMAKQHGINVTLCFLLRLHPSFPSYELVRCVDLSNEAHQLLDSM